MTSTYINLFILKLFTKAWDKFVDEPMRFEYALYDIFGDIYKIVEEEVAMEIALAFSIDYNGENFVQLAKKFKKLGIM